MSSTHSKKITVKLPDGRSFDRQADRHRSGHRHRAAQDQQRQAASHRRVRRRPAAARRRLGGRGGQSLRSFQLGDRGHRLLDRPRHRKRSSYTDFIQIDAPINRGNSGGPTFDLRGQVIGMNSMIFSPSGGSVGIGFAIPASTIHDVVAQLQAHGHVARGYLGVNIQSVTPEIAASLGIKDSQGRASSPKSCRAARPPRPASSRATSSSRSTASRWTTIRAI